MTEDEVRELAATLSDEDMRRLRRELILRFDSRMEQITQFMRQHEQDIERLALGGYGTDTGDADLVTKLADFALFFFVTGDNKTFVEDLARERGDD
jgi:hypothetical protein